jgi:hypothetical protein
VEVDAVIGLAEDVFEELADDHVVVRVAADEAGAFGFVAPFREPGFDLLAEVGFDLDRIGLDDGKFFELGELAGGLKHDFEALDVWRSGAGGSFFEGFVTARAFFVGDGFLLDRELADGFAGDEVEAFAPRRR